MASQKRTGRKRTANSLAQVRGQATRAADHLVQLGMMATAIAATRIEFHTDD